MKYQDVLDYYARRNKKIKSLKKAGMTYKEISHKYGLTRQRTEQIVKDKRKGT